MAPTALIADDEPKLAQDLAERLKQLWGELHIVAVVPNGIQAVAELNRLRPQYAFLDIRMPGLSGLDAAKTATGTRVVFVTAYDEYAIAAFDAAAADYLLKPVSDARLAQCVARLQREAAPPIDLQKLMSTFASPAREHLAWLTVGLANTTRLVAVNSVLYFQSTGKYTEVVTGLERHLIRTSLKELMLSLDPKAFLQIHRGTIVNLRSIAKVERDWRDQPVITLKARPEKLTVSRTFAHRFKAM